MCASVGVRMYVRVHVRVRACRLAGQGLRSEAKEGRVKGEGRHFPTLKKTTSCVTQNTLWAGLSHRLSGSGVTLVPPSPVPAFSAAAPPAAASCGMRGQSLEGVTASLYPGPRGVN